MGRKKKPKPQDPEQYAAFVELAERIQTEDADERFKEAIKKIAKAKPRKPKQSD
jgi:hypothetical protein